MPDSGVKADPDVMSTCETMKMKKLYSYVILRITKNEKSIEVTKKGKSYFGEDEKSSDPVSREKSQLRFQELCWDLGFGQKPETVEEGAEQLGPEDAAYIVCDARIETKAKLVLITWIPEDAKPKTKMLYTSSKDGLKKKLNVSEGVQANAPDDLLYDIVMERVK